MFTFGDHLKRYIEDNNLKDLEVVEIKTEDGNRPIIRKKNEVNKVAVVLK